MTDLLNPHPDEGCLNRRLGMGNTITGAARYKMNQAFETTEAFSVRVRTAQWDSSPMAESTLTATAEATRITGTNARSYNIQNYENGRFECI